MVDFLGDTADLLRRTAELLRSLLTGLPDAWTDTSDTDGGWRPRDVVGHLISAELDDWMPRASRILEHGTALAFDPFDRFAHVYRRVDGGSLTGIKDLTDASAGIDAAVDRIAKLPTWPWPPQVLRGFISAILLPVIVFVITRYVGSQA